MVTEAHINLSRGELRILFPNSDYGYYTIAEIKDGVLNKGPCDVSDSVHFRHFLNFRFDEEIKIKIEIVTEE